MTRRLLLMLAAVVITQTLLSGCHRRHFCRIHRPCLRPCLLRPVIDPCCCPPACDTCCKPDAPVTISPPIVDPLAAPPGLPIGPEIPAIRPGPPLIQESAPPPGQGGQ